MNRRQFQRTAVAVAAAAGWPTVVRAETRRTDRAAHDAAAARADWSAIEAASGGRLGVAVLRGDGRIDGHRLDERFPMCSTFKWLATANVLARVDRGEERLDRRVRFGREVLLAHSPVTTPHAGTADGMTIAELCDAAITESDNAAANLLLARLGGPAGVTRFVRTLGDDATRLDRTEPTLNASRPGDPRDTTTPRAMAASMRRAVLGDALAPASRAQLARWLEATKTNGRRLGAAVPPGWRLGSKTGTGAHGSTNDVGVFWPPSGEAFVVAVYLTATQASEDARNGAIAAVARAVTSM